MELSNRVVKQLYTIIIGTLLLLLTPSIALAGQYKIYTQDGIIEAPFPGKPEDIGSVYSDGYEYKGYNYIDYQSQLSFTSTLQVNEVYYSKQNIDKAIENFINGSALAMNGKVVFKSIGNIARSRGAYFKITMVYQGVQMHKSAAVLYEKVISIHGQS